MLIYWFLPMILALGIVTSYEDVKHGKIRNKWVLIALSYSLLLYSFLFLMDKIDINFALFSFANGFLALISGILLWLMKFWNAGDAKLLFSFALLLPTAGSFNFDDVLINAFVPIALVLLIASLFKADKNRIFKSFNFNSLIYAALFLFAIIWPISLIADLIGFFEIRLVLVLLAALFLIKFQKQSLAIYLALISLSILRLIFDKSIYLPETWAFFALILFLVFALRFALTAMHDSGKKSKKVKKDTISFAPFIFAGALLQVILNNNIMGYIAGLF